MSDRPDTVPPNENLRDCPRVRIRCEASRYADEIGFILGSTCEGRFVVYVDIEGGPRIYLPPEQVEPC